MKAKIICILVMTLLITTALPALGTMNNEKDIVLKQSSNKAIVWSDNFDSYTLGQFLDGTPDDGGWKCWNNKPIFGAYVVDDEALSSPHSVDVTGNTDILQGFTGICSGNWTVTCWNYVPTDFSALSYFYMMSYYRDNISWSDLRWQLSLMFNGIDDTVTSRDYGQTLPLIKGQWVEIRVEIDLNADWFECYYNDQLIDEKKWTAGTENTNDGYFNLNTVNIWAAGSNSVYYDDFSLEGEHGPIPDLACEGQIKLEKVKPGETVKGDFIVENIGDPNSVLDWELIEWPGWENTSWTFSTEGGRLKPEDGPFTVEVTIEAPDEKDTYTGVIKLCAICDPNNCCEIPVTLIVPRNKAINNLFLQFLQSHPNMFPILQKLLQNFGL